jgi:hypothetical protein
MPDKTPTPRPWVGGGGGPRSRGHAQDGACARDSTPKNVSSSEHNGLPSPRIACPHDGIAWLTCRQLCAAGVAAWRCVARAHRYSEPGLGNGPPGRGGGDWRRRIAPSGDLRSSSAHERRRRAPAFMSSQRLRTVSAVPHWRAPGLWVSALRVSAAMHCRPDWREEQVVVPTALRPLWWVRWIGCRWPGGSSYIR